ncbi:MAG: sigma-54 dependent transcriptional regulator [bacterium]
MKGTILVVDDERNITRSLSSILAGEDYDVITAPDFAEGRRMAANPGIDVALLDVKLPDGNGLELLQYFTKQRPDVAVVMMSGHGTIETAVSATKFGAFDFLEKPISLDKLLITVENARKLKRVVAENERLKVAAGSKATMVWASPAMKDLIARVELVAPTGGWVLITGENGTGKEMIAHAIHDGSPRRNHPFIKVNCAAIPSELIESELFGHVKGAFTDAQQDKPGKFELAHRGTILLDEIGDMALQTQAKVLRVLQEREFERVGGAETIKVDVRVITATNKNLPELVEQGKFREDLFYRLNVVPFHILPLRERREDIPLLTEYYANYLAGEYGRPTKHFTPKALKVFESYDWPGNVRELKNMVERLIIMLPEEEVDAPAVERIFRQDLPGSRASQSAGANAAAPTIALAIDKSYKDAMADFEEQYIRARLTANTGNVSQTAKDLGLERSHLYKKMRALGIEKGE